MTFTCIYVYTFVYVYIYIYIHVCIYIICTFACTHIYIYTCARHIHYTYAMIRRPYSSTQKGSPAFNFSKGAIHATIPDCISTCPLWLCEICSKSHHMCASFCYRRFSPPYEMPWGRVTQIVRAAVFTAISKAMRSGDANCARSNINC